MNVIINDDFMTNKNIELLNEANKLFLKKLFRDSLPIYDEILKSEPTIKRSFWIFISIFLILESESKEIAIPRVEFNSSIAPYDMILPFDFQTLVLSNNDVLPSSPVFVYIFNN